MKIYRDFMFIANCDAGIIVGGRWGTLDEFTNLVEMAKPAGVFTGTGGIADILPDLTRKVKKKIESEIIFDSNPGKLVDSVLKLLKTA